MHKRTGRISAAVLAACVAVTMSACSDDKDKSDSGSTPSMSGVKASGDPIKVGLFNPSDGAVKSPGVDTGRKAATKYINEVIGGIGGRPIEVVNCAVDTTSPETTIGCANRLAQAKVVAVVDGFNTSSSAALKILKSANIPLVGQIPFDSVTGASGDNRVYFGPPQASFLVGDMQNIKKMGKKSLTMANVDVPAVHQTFDRIMAPVGKMLGLDVKPVYYSATNPNFTAVATNIKSGNPDVGGLLTSQLDSTCDKLAQALRSVGFKNTLLMAACTDFVDKMGAQAVGALTHSPIWLPPSKDSVPAENKENLAAATTMIDEDGGSAGFYAYATFATFVDFAKILTAAKPAEFTGASVLQGLKGAKDYQSFLGPKLNCGKTSSPNCTTQMLMFEVKEGKKTTPYGGGYTDPAPEALKMVPGAS